VDSRQTSRIAGPCVWLAKDLIGMKVVSTQDEKLGRIEDVVVHTGGDAAYAVLSFGGVLGLGQRYFALPWSVLRAVEGDRDGVGERKLVLFVHKDRLQKAPGFDPDHWPIMAKHDWASNVDGYYADPSGESRSWGPSASTTAANIWRCTDLQGHSVKTPAGEKLGEIKEIAFDLSGRISYVALGVGGFLGIGERLVAVPWSALRFSLLGDDRAITLETSKKQIERAPEFLSDALKSREMCDPAWIGTLHEYYAAPPYWLPTPTSSSSSREYAATRRDDRSSFR
jgi:sporulation protein YlmC with PRC-barrel domain